MTLLVYVGLPELLLKRSAVQACSACCASAANAADASAGDKGWYNRTLAQTLSVMG